MTEKNKSFSERLTQNIIEKDSPLCVGLDPFVNLMPKLFGSPKSIYNWEIFFNEIIDIIAPKVPIIKPQIGLFEPWGGDGINLVSRLSQKASEQGLMVILDAKRGDIGSTAQGYADAYLGENTMIDCDCITLNPYMGIETLMPFVEYAKKLNKGIAVLVRTSNPGAVDFQDLLIDGEPLWVHVAKKLQPVENMLADGNKSSLMVVVGATWPEEAKRIREILPKSQFLIPGYGAQGADAEGALSGLVKKNGKLVGGVVNSSRGILYPKGSYDAKTTKEWRQFIIDAVNHAIKDLRTASQNVVNME